MSCTSESGKLPGSARLIGRLRFRAECVKTGLVARERRRSRSRKRRMLASGALLVILLLISSASAFASTKESAFFEKHCFDCHDADSHKGNLDLTSLKPDFADGDVFRRWVKVYDRVRAGEMPPKKVKERPTADELKDVTGWLLASLTQSDKARLDLENRTGVRRLTRAEYENTIRDLFDMPGIALQNMLPVDGSAHGYDKNYEALDISHVNLATYIQAADKTLDLAICDRPTAPPVHKRRMSLMNNGGFVAGVVMNGDGVLLRDKKPDPDFPPAGEYVHVDEGAHARMGLFSTRSATGLFRHEDESLSPYFIEHVTIYPGMYRVRTSLWSFTWDKGKVLPSRGTEAARLSVVQLTGDGRGGQHPSYVLGYYDAPSINSQLHELTTWMNVNEIIGFNTASLAPVANYARKDHAMAFTGPGIAVDWLEIEGPLHDVWPPVAHQRLFGDLPIVEFKPKENPNLTPPTRVKIKQIGAGKNRPDPIPGIWTVKSDHALADADRLLGSFLPKLFRRPVDADTRQEYLDQVAQRLKAGDCFESAMRWAYRAALCSPDFLYHIEPPGRLDDYALASRLSYLFWNSLPDEELIHLAAQGTLHEPKTLDAQVERMLKDPKSERFVNDFLGQWLKLREIASNDPDKKLYPEFSPYLQDSMLAESRAYYRELIDRNLDAGYLVKSDFAMLNQKLAAFYGVPGVIGADIRRVELPADCPRRGGFLTQAAVLKVTANGTTTSPVPRGAFVMARLLGKPPEPPPPNLPTIEPDVRGAHTIREQLDKHRSQATCAACHAKIDPAGFALESFDVIGGWRDRYRIIGDDGAPLPPAPRGNIDPFIAIKFSLGQPVDASGQLPDGQKFHDVNGLETILAADRHTLLHNLAEQLTIYGTGRDVAFSDRPAMDALVARTESAGGGLRTLLHELVKSELFQTR